MSNPQCPEMKKLGYSGFPLIIPPFRRTPPPFDGKIHDPWPAHAVGPFHTIESHDCASGNWVLAGTFQLVSTDIFFYPMVIDTFTNIEALRAAYLAAPFFGEEWNYVLRPQPFDKVIFADWAAWLAAH